MGTTFARLRSGAWGIRTTETDLRPGDQIEVTTKAGDARTETIDRVIWSGTDRETGATVALCSILPSLPPPRRAKRPPRSEPRTVRHSMHRIGGAEVEFAGADAEGWDF